MKALEYLRHIGILENENSKFLIKFEDGREFDVVEILEDYKASIYEILCKDEEIDLKTILKIRKKIF